jgi:hypothetical protein
MDPRATQKDRIRALLAMSRPPIEMLLRLIKSEATPLRIRALAIEIYDAELTVRKAMLAARTVPAKS